jgi:hypothetical protein
VLFGVVFKVWSSSLPVLEHPPCRISREHKIRNVAFLVVTPCSSEREVEVSEEHTPPSSESKHKPSKKASEAVNKLS